jgi:uncharacterized protein YacL
MERNSLLYRVIFFLISCITAITYEFSLGASGVASALFVGFMKGGLIFLLIIGLEASLRGISLRTFNTTLVGLALGALMGYVTVEVFGVLFSFLNLKLIPELTNFLASFVYLAALYLGIKATHAQAEVWWMSIPFVQLAPTGQAKKKELFLDISAIEDSRLADLARSGILDHQLVIPSFVLKEIQKGIDAQDEATKIRFRKCFEQIKRLENMPNLGLAIKEFHTSEADDLGTKLSRTAKLVGAYILTSEQNTIKQTEEEGVTIISIEAIANAIKPTAQRGEILTIKIQRPGKEPKQGVGYLEDGTMVVVNGGGDFLGETIKTLVLSQKYSSSGKIIFCNAITQDDKAPATRPPGHPEEVHTPVSPYTYSTERQPEVAGPIRMKKEGFYDPWHRH